ncbi:uncharacterized protein LOC135126021 [Zophobas morio]
MAMRKNLKYSEDSMRQALHDVKSGMPVARAAKKYNVPRITLYYKKMGKYPEDRRIGAPTVLTVAEEQALVKWCFFLSDRGFPVTKNQLLDSVQLLIKTMKRPNPFQNNRPGRHWYELFLKRHPRVSSRTPQNLTSSRTNVTEENIRHWFIEITEYFIQNDLMDAMSDPTRVYNADETAFFLSPKGSRVLVRKGQKSVYSFVANDEKECLTSLINANAAGKLAPPMILFSYERIPAAISSLMPTNFSIGKSESGWMTGETFYEYVTNIFYPWLVENNIKFPIVFFVDGHVSHLTLSLSNFCKEKKIELVALYPNATHLLQPMDVAVFHTLKQTWKTSVHNWRVSHSYEKIKREDFAPLLHETLKKTCSVETIQNGFKRCGLYPLNPDAVDYTKIKNVSGISKQSDDNLNNSNLEGYDVKGCLQIIEKIIGSEKTLEFKSLASKEWNGNIEDTSLYRLWMSLNDSLVGDVAEERNLQESNEQNLQDRFQTDAQSLEGYGSPKTDEQLLLEAEQMENFIDNLEIPKDQPTSSNCLDVPSPFKQCLFWPATPKKKDGKRKPKEKIPSVATSFQWQEYHKKKNAEKKKKEDEKLERKRKREEKSILKEGSKNQRKTGKLSPDQQDSEENTSQCLDTLNIGDYVVVEYNKKYFPGLILNVDEGNLSKYHDDDLYNFQISAMEKSGCSGWRWPKRKDVLWYKLEDIKQSISKPVLINNNKRGLFAIPEMDKYI